MWCTEFGVCFQAPRGTDETMFDGSQHWGTFQGRDCTKKVCVVCAGSGIPTIGKSLENCVYMEMSLDVHIEVDLWYSSLMQKNKKNPQWAVPILN